MVSAYGKSNNIFIYSDDKNDVKNEFSTQSLFCQAPSNPEEPRNPGDDKLIDMKERIKNFSDLLLTIKIREEELAKLKAQLEIEREELGKLQGDKLNQ